MCGSFLYGLLLVLCIAAASSAAFVAADAAAASLADTATAADAVMLDGSYSWILGCCFLAINNVGV